MITEQGFENKEFPLVYFCHRQHNVLKKIRNLTDYLLPWLPNANKTRLNEFFILIRKCKHLSVRS